MKIPATCFILSFLSFASLVGQPYIGTYYSPDHRDGTVITLKEENGLFSGTLRVEGEVYQVECRDKGGFLEGQVLGKPIHVSIVQNGPYIELGLAELKWGIAPDPATARTYVLELQGEASSAAANYVQSGPGGNQAVVFNGVLLERKQLEEFYNQYHYHPLPGNYWYDPISGLYGAIGYDAFGYLRPGHDYGPMLANSSRGDSRYFINGRCLTRREALVWRQLLGRDLRPGNYHFDDRGMLGWEGGRDFNFNLFDQVDVTALGIPPGMGEWYWTNRFKRGRKGDQGRRGYYSVPGYGPKNYGFYGDLEPRK